MSNLSPAQQQRNAKAQEALRKYRENNKVGRPAGSYGVKKLAKIKSEQAFVKEFEKDLRPIFDSLLDKAIGGDVHAIQLILNRLWGTPKGSLDLNANIKLSLADLAVEASRLEDQPTYKEIEPIQDVTDEI